VKRRKSGASRPELSRYRWQKTRARVKARDGHACVYCRSTWNLSVHHILKARLGGSDDDSNLVTVCSRCHALLDRPGYGGYRAEAPASTPRVRPRRENKLVEPAGPFSRAW
jgi:5-methylcytosine-specific restriction endonuclease McrA